MRGQQDVDVRRDAFLARLGVRVVRFNPYTAEGRERPDWPAAVVQLLAEELVRLRAPVACEA